MISPPAAARAHPPKRGPASVAKLRNEHSTLISRPRMSDNVADMLASSAPIPGVKSGGKQRHSLRQIAEIVAAAT